MPLEYGIPEYCPRCKWQGLQKDALISFDEHNEIVIFCPECQNDITWNLQTAGRRVNWFRVWLFDVPVLAILSIFITLALLAWFAACFILNLPYTGPKQHFTKITQLFKKDLKHP